MRNTAEGKPLKHRKLFWLLLLALAVSQPLSAQVEKAVADAAGIT